MTENISRPPRTIWVGFLLFFSLVVLAFLLWLAQAARIQPLRVIGSVADFALTNQDGHITTLANLTNHVWVADIIFTRCAGPCPRMTGQMKSLQEKLPMESDAKLVTLTTDPEFDSPEVLKKYAARFNADTNRWTFLTGTKSEIAALGSGSLKLSAVPVKLEDQKSVADLFIHTTIFVIVDKHAQLRGFYETGGDGVDWTNSVQPKVLQAVRQLENEP
ncbi:MAG TPA: SCO family protein [Verrucomicrobiae bacterium]|jgi:cytochrome oxidase Cu insertion factor (SCO1/SenC/PrrC family)